VASDSVHITNAANGKSLRGNLLNAEGVGEQSTAARNAKKAPGSIIATGV